MRGNSIREAGFHNANQITKEIQGVKENLESMQEAQRTVLSAIEDNQSMMSVVANHMGQTYHDGRCEFVLPQSLQDENTPPPEQQANAASSEISNLLQNLANEISTLKGKMETMQQQPTQPLQPSFNPNLQYGQYGGGRGNGQ